MNELQTVQNVSEASGDESNAAFTDLRDYSPFEGLFAWVCIVIGYLFCRAFPPTRYPLGMLLVSVVCVAVTFYVLVRRKARIGAAGIVCALLSPAFAFAYLLNTELFPVVIAFFCSVTAYCFFVYRSSGNVLSKGDADFLPLALLRALNGFSVFAIADMFRLMFTRKNKSFKAVLKIVIGLAVAAVPTALVVTLLSYDGGFSEMLGNAFSFLNELDLGEQLISLLLGVVVAMYIFGVYAINTSERKPIDCEKYRIGIRKVRVAPMLTVGAALLPLAVVYIFFFVSQWQYYVSGFSGALPEGVVNYAEYARSGFFELCAVSAINLAIIVAMTVFARRSSRSEAIFLRAVSVVFSLMTLVLIGTALAKMALYIDRFGLTEKRFLSSWLMIVIAFIFLFIIIHSFASRFKLLAATTVTVVVMCGVLVFSNYSALIADHNVDRYISGETEKIDTAALINGDVSSVPAIIRLMEHYEDQAQSQNYDIDRIKEYKRLKNELLQHREELEAKDGIFEFSFTEQRARLALEEYFAKNPSGTTEP